MNFDQSRRSLIVGIGSTMVASAGLPALVKAQTGRRQESFSVGMPKEGPDTPKLAAPLDARSITDQSMRAVKQLGVDHVLMGGPPMPWKQSELRAIVDQCKTGGLVVGNMMISGFPNTIYGRPRRDKEIELFQDSIRAAGKVGVPTIEYNFYAHRAIEGYYEVNGRGGAGLTGFDVDRVKTCRHYRKKVCIRLMRCGATSPIF